MIQQDIVSSIKSAVLSRCQKGTIEGHLMALCLNLKSRVNELKPILQRKE